MPKSNFRTLSFFFLCFSSFYFCQGQDSLRTLKSERYYYKGKVFKAVYYNEKGQRTLDWENDVGVYEFAPKGLSFYSYDSLENDKISTHYNVKVKDETRVTFLRERGEPDGRIYSTKTDSIIGREFTEEYIFQLTENRREYSMEELQEIELFPTFDKIKTEPCKEIIDSTLTRRIFRSDLGSGAEYFEDYTYDTLGNFIHGHTEFIYSGNKHIAEYTTKGNSTHRISKSFQSPETDNKLVSEQEHISVNNYKKQRIKTESYRINLKTGTKKLEETIEYEYLGDRLEKQTITRSRKKYVVEISRTYW
ncbi:hypothetical protein [Arcticibacterium luteifluviistationis]|uniref:Uncharacterized protein n=1 Tax=Arcticibacterium luteifluviistationis TaxID=1784714 RepID=A0A2Z4G8V8_9BACT|nr:hypothetical protein [Arcticibacterium luteifluviistationis]AWV97373.1 hypothetical protein DJ013_03975 [Arcticibacterium luteifluviistationis]